MPLQLQTSIRCDVPPRPAQLGLRSMHGTFVAGSSLGNGGPGEHFEPIFKTCETAYGELPRGRPQCSLILLRYLRLCDRTATLVVFLQQNVARRTKPSSAFHYDRRAGAAIAFTLVDRELGLLAQIRPAVFLALRDCRK